MPTAAVQLSNAKPVLKWAGGKRQLLAQLRPFFPAEFGTYFEPFLGSAAVYFDLVARAQLTGRARLSDINGDLIGCYRAIRDDVSLVISALGRLERAHHSRAESGGYYYKVRDQWFNRARQNHTESDYPPRLAAMFLYLNRTGFNGLYRVNSKGHFNVPAGAAGPRRICNPDTLRVASVAFNQPKTTIRKTGFRSAVRSASPGDFVYFDPPYVPLSETSSFTAYANPPFGANEQGALRDTVVRLATRGCYVLVSNSSSPVVQALYSTEACRRAGIRIHEVWARRAINCDGSARGAVKELIVTNIAE